MVQQAVWKRYDNNYEDSLMMARVLWRNMLQKIYVKNIFGACEVGFEK